MYKNIAHPVRYMKLAPGRFRRTVLNMRAGSRKHMKAAQKDWRLDLIADRIPRTLRIARFL